MNSLSEKTSGSNSDDPESIHSQVIPLQVRKGDGISGVVTLTSNGVESRHEIDVWTLSPLGIEFICNSVELTVGSEVDLELTVADQLCRFYGLIALNAHNENGKRTIGIRWCSKHVEKYDTDRRKAKRWLCGTEYLPTGIAPNPLKFNDFVLFRVHDISRIGMQLLTSLRNKNLIPGMRLASIITFPMFGQLKVDLEITNTKIVQDSGKDFISLGVTLLNADESLIEVMGQYILQFAPYSSVIELKKDGFPVRTVSSSLSFSFVRTTTEYREVLALRRKCYSLAGKIASDVKDGQLADGFDTRSRILIVRCKGELVASVRITYPEMGTAVEHEQFVILPDSFPRKDEMIDISRLCTHPDFRGSDLLIAIFREIGIIAVQSRRQWIIGSSTDKLLPIYRKIGMKPTPLHYQHESLGGERHTLFIADCYAVIMGKKINPLIWNVLYSDLAAFVSSREFLKFSPAVHARLAFYRLLNPFARAIFSRKMTHPKRKREKPKALPLA